ncbi:MAG: CBASS cGAMP-activated phospholipase [Chloroflexota bacterium]|nr:CBASS cGAMP-activated phospholipase [Chloroflexota bacterium]
MEPDENFYILALDGGGARGIYPAHILARLERELSIPIGECFDLITGTSTGSIIAGAAAAGVAMQTVADLFEDQAPAIFSRKRFGWGLFRSKYERQPLAQIVQQFLPELRMGEITTPLLITSTDISTGGVRVIKSRYLQEQGQEYVRDGDVPLRDAILASCAAPSFFDPMQVDDYLLADGGLWANNPSILAATEAVSKFGRPLSRVHILSIGTGKPRHLYERGRSWGIATGWGRLKLVSYFLDLQSQASTNMATLLLEDRYFRMNPEIENWGLDDTRHLIALKVKADSDFTRDFGEIQKKIKRGCGQRSETESASIRGSPGGLQLQKTVNT